MKQILITAPPEEAVPEGAVPVGGHKRCSIAAELEALQEIKRLGGTWVYELGYGARYGGVVHLGVHVGTQTFWLSHAVDVCKEHGVLHTAFMRDGGEVAEYPLDGDWLPTVLDNLVSEAAEILNERGGLARHVKRGPMSLRDCLFGAERGEEDTPTTEETRLSLEDWL